MKKPVSLLAALFLCLLTVPAIAAQPGYYIGANAGVMIPETSRFTVAGTDVAITYDAGFTASAIGGYKFNNGIRLEGEINGRSATTSKLEALGTSLKYDSTVSAVGGMANAYYDISTGTSFTPYVGGGIGVAYLFTSDSTVNAVGTTIPVYKNSGSAVLAYQAAAGIAYDITKHVTLDLGYRYYGTTTARLEYATPPAGNDKVTFNSHNVIVGARYNF